MDRYSRNKNMINSEQQQILADKRVVVLGCGGLGGYIIEMLARLGVGELKVVDFDFFDSTNLNRQLLSSEDNIGSSKVGAAIERVQSINSDTEVIGVVRKIDERNLSEIITGYDLVVDALDSIPLKINVEKICSLEDITLVHGAIGGWIAQVAVVRPGESILAKIYGEIEEGIEKNMGNPSFTPALAASIQVSEILKVLLDKDSTLSKEVIYIDLENNDFTKLEIL